MSITIEAIYEAGILKPLAPLPGLADQSKVRVTVEPAAQPVSTKPPLDRRVPCEPMPDRTREWAWIATHKQEYAGQWVALDGDQLLAASLIQQEVFDAIKTERARRPLIHRISSPDDLPFIGI